MSIVTDKYRGTDAYNQVREKLVEAAAQNKNLYYGHIAKLMRLPPGEPMRKEVGHILGEINEDECGKGHPMLSALVVDSLEKTPGEGFFRLAEKLDKFHGSTETDRMDFWRQELQKVYAHW